MGSDSFARRAAKMALYPVLNERTYQLFQSAAKAWDIRRGAWSEPELDLIPYAVRSGDVVLDIGANYGLYSYHLSRAVGRSGKVYAFEPVPFTAQTFSKVASLLRFRNVELVPKGCGDEPGTIAFALPVQKSGAISAGLAHFATRDNERSGKDEHFRYESTREILCDVVVLDDYLPDLPEVSLIKTDAEGGDLFVLRGAANLIDQHHPTVICEVNPWFLQGFGLRADELVGFFTDRGYRMYQYDPQCRSLDEVTLEDVGDSNYVFVHPQREPQLADLLNSGRSRTVPTER